MRFYIVNPSVSSNGDPIGGVQGTILGIQKVIKEINPDRIAMCWDGSGGSRKRKLLDKNYKEGRTPPRLNWDSVFLNEKDKEQNKIWQLYRLFEYFEHMPVFNIKFDDIEADDIIAAVCQLEHFKDYQKVILSSDKDFTQLINNKTVLYRPVQKEILNIKRVIEKYNIHPNNFALARSVCGDKSDNIEGIKGAGLPTVSKRFPFLVESKDFNIEDLTLYCQKQIDGESKIKLYREVLDNVDKIIINYKLTQLSSPNVSIQSKNIIKEIVEDERFIWNKSKFITMMIQDGFGTYDWSFLVQTFNRIMRDSNENR